MSVATTDKNLVQLVLDRYETARAARQAWEEMWLRCYQLYRGYREDLPPEEADRANLHIPKVFAHIESIAPRVVAAQLSTRPWVAVHPREPGDEQRAKVTEELIEYQFDRQDLFSKYVSMTKEALMYGTSVGKLTWRYETEQRRIRRQEPIIVGGIDLTALFGLAPRWVEDDAELVVWDDPWLEHIDLFDFFPDPDGRSISEMRYVIHRSFTSVEDMEASGLYEHLDVVRKTLGDMQDRPSDLRRSAIGRGGGPSAADSTRPVELLEMWEDDRVVVIANRSVVVRDEPNPFWHGKKPFIAIKDTPLPHEFWGLGTIEPIRYLQEEVNARRNQRMDNVTLALQRMFVVARNAGVDPDDLVWRPGGVVWVDSFDDVNKMIQPITVPEVTSSSYQEEGLIDKDMEDATGASEFARGMMPTRSATATEIQQLSMATSSRVDLKVRMMAHQGLRAIAQHFILLNQQFMEQERFVRITGRSGYEWVRVGPEDIIGEFDLIPAAANVETFANKHQKRADLQEFMSIAGSIPAIAERINWEYMLERLAELYDFPNTDELMAPMQPEAPMGGLPAEAAAAPPLEQLLLGGGAGVPGPTPAAPF